jgi:uncharacterized protein (TIGR03067 family)
MILHSLLAVALALVAADAPKDDAKKDLDKLQGTWTIASGKYDGEELDANLVSKLSFEIKGDQFLIKGDDEVTKQYAKIALKLDPTAKPKLIDFHVTQGDDKGNTIEGIYELKDDEFKICAKLDAKERPTEFKSDENSHVALVVFKRQGK